MNIQEKIEAAGKKKDEGNAMFNAGKYQRAIKRYGQVRMIHAIMMKQGALELNTCC